jgi:hypothetical protein
MFFSITHQPKENFPNHYRLGKFVVNTDNGWTETEYKNYKILYKGYADDLALEDLFEEWITQTIPTHTGNFCAFVIDSDSIKICNDLYRGFPIFYNQGKEVTNLVPLEQTVYADNVVTIDSNLNVEYPLKSNFDVIGAIDTSPLGIDQVINSIDQILSTRTQSFLTHNKLPVKVHLSGGVDSLLVYSYLQKYTDNFELVKAHHIDYDRFYLINLEQLKSYWGYTQIHHWVDPCVLTSGAPGDEFMLRSPMTSDQFIKHRGLAIKELLTQPRWADCLHRDYFLRPKYAEVFDQTIPSWTEEQMTRALCNNIVNDWQHWHLGNTLTWTPLKDLNIFKLLLRLDTDSALSQILNSAISKALIERNYPGLTQVISTQKNTGSYMKNLCDFYDSLSH